MMLSRGTISSDSGLRLSARADYWNSWSFYIPDNDAAAAGGNINVKNGGVSPFYKLPQEVFDHIVGFLHGDKASLHQCSLINRDWVVPSQRHLFSDIYLVSKKPESLTGLLERFTGFLKNAASRPNHTIIPSIHHLYIDANAKGPRAARYRMITVSAIEGVLDYLPSLKSISLYDVILSASLTGPATCPRRSLDCLRFARTVVDDGGYLQLFSLFGNIERVDLAELHYTPDSTQSQTNIRKTTVTKICLSEGTMNQLFPVINFDTVKCCIMWICDLKDIQFLQDLCGIADTTHLGIVFSLDDEDMDKVAEFPFQLRYPSVQYLELRIDTPTECFPQRLDLWWLHTPYITAAPSLIQLHLSMFVSASFPTGYLEELDWQVLRNIMRSMRYLKILSLHLFLSEEFDAAESLPIQACFYRLITDIVEDLPIDFRLSASKYNYSAGATSRFEVDFIDFPPWSI
ncbi:hypothetical protein K474DRAFT_1378299 [Panus rudis PR-1116 ss-1]|nr:hypothetical protein K474DRAFT_1378299 [Panus rudis PR-1116 ss-1]